MYQTATVSIPMTISTARTVRAHQTNEFILWFVDAVVNPRAEAALVSAPVRSAAIHKNGVNYPIPWKDASWIPIPITVAKWTLSIRNVDVRAERKQMLYFTRTVKQTL